MAGVTHIKGTVSDICMKDNFINSLVYSRNVGHEKYLIQQKRAGEVWLEWRT